MHSQNHRHREKKVALPLPEFRVCLGILALDSRVLGAAGGGGGGVEDVLRLQMSDDPMLTGLINASAKEQQYGGTPARFCESLVPRQRRCSPAPQRPRCPARRR